MTLAAVTIVMMEAARVGTEADAPEKRVQSDHLKRDALSSAADAGRCDFIKLQIVSDNVKREKTI